MKRAFYIDLTKQSLNKKRKMNFRGAVKPIVVSSSDVEDETVEAMDDTMIEKNDIAREESDDEQVAEDIVDSDEEIVNKSAAEDAEESIFSKTKSYIIEHSTTTTPVESDKESIASEAEELVEEQVASEVEDQVEDASEVEESVTPVSTSSKPIKRSNKEDTAEFLRLAKLLNYTVKPIRPRGRPSRASMEGSDKQDDFTERRSGRKSVDMKDSAIVSRPVREKRKTTVELLTSDEEATKPVREKRKTAVELMTRDGEVCIVLVIVIQGH